MTCHLQVQCYLGCSGNGGVDVQVELAVYVQLAVQTELAVQLKLAVHPELAVQIEAAGHAEKAAAPAGLLEGQLAGAEPAGLAELADLPEFAGPAFGWPFASASWPA